MWILSHFPDLYVRETDAIEDMLPLVVDYCRLSLLFPCRHKQSTTHSERRPDLDKL